METFSPVDVADRIEADVLAAHVDLATDDGIGPLVTDVVTAWAFLQGVLRAQEDWPWG